MWFQLYSRRDKPVQREENKTKDAYLYTGRLSPLTQLRRLEPTKSMKDWNRNGMDGRRDVERNARILIFGWECRWDEDWGKEGCKNVIQVIIFLQQSRRGGVGGAVSLIWNCRLKGQNLVGHETVRTPSISPSLQ